MVIIYHDIQQASIENYQGEDIILKHQQSALCSFILSVKFLDCASSFGLFHNSLKLSTNLGYECKDLVILMTGPWIPPQKKTHINK